MHMHAYIYVQCCEFALLYSVGTVLYMNVHRQGEACTGLVGDGRCWEWCGMGWYDAIWHGACVVGQVWDGTVECVWWCGMARWSVCTCGGMRWYGGVCVV